MWILCFLCIKENLSKNELVYLHLGGPVGVVTVVVLVVVTVLEVVGAKLKKHFLLEWLE